MGTTTLSRLLTLSAKHRGGWEALETTRERHHAVHGRFREHQLRAFWSLVAPQEQSPPCAGEARMTAPVHTALRLSAICGGAHVIWSSNRGNTGACELGAFLDTVRGERFPLAADALVYADSIIPLALLARQA